MNRNIYLYDALDSHNLMSNTTVMKSVVSRIFSTTRVWAYRGLCARFTSTYAISHGSMMMDEIFWYLLMTKQSRIYDGSIFPDYCWLLFTLSSVENTGKSTKRSKKPCSSNNSCNHSNILSCSSRGFVT
jgi:hypothetical protein